MNKLIICGLILILLATTMDAYLGSIPRQEKPQCINIIDDDANPVEVLNMAQYVPSKCLSLLQSEVDKNG
jgi:hypothetical protein